MTVAPETAMLLAAGLGARMRPITGTMPKPLVRVADKALIDWTLDPLAAAGVKRAVVNVHYFPGQIREHVAARTIPAVTISDESASLLDSGGGIVQALPLLGDNPFFVCNCDSILVPAPGQPSAFQKLTAAWDASKLDIAMLVHPMESAHGFDGPGDFFVESNGTIIRRGSTAIAPYVCAGVWIAHPRVFAGEQPVPFSANIIWDRAIAARRMIAVVNDGEWYHVGTPGAVTATSAALSGMTP